MRCVRISPERFKALRDETGITAYELARLIGSSSSHLWRITSGRHTTSFRFLARLVPVFGLVAVSGMIADEQQGEAFTRWFNAQNHQHQTA